MSETLPTLNLVILCLNVAGAVVALAALLPLSKVAKLSRSHELQCAWQAMVLVMFVCIGLLISSAVVSIHAELGIFDLLATGIHILGPIFVFGVAHLSLLTARDLLRIDQLEVAAHTDPLTAALNRAGFVAAVEPKETNVGIIMADLDHFKRINDRLGHEAGDHVLRQFVERARQVLPTGSYLARFGGEEFVIALPETTLEATFGVAERLRAAANSHQIEWPGGPILITASFGVSSAASGRDLAAAISEADKALYGAKHLGRNQVRTA